MFSSYWEGIRECGIDFLSAGWILAVMQSLADAHVDTTDLSEEQCEVRSSGVL